MIETEKRRKSMHDRKQTDQPTPAGAAPEEPPALAEPMASWVAAATQARHLLLQYAQTREGRIPAQSRLIERTMSDLTDLIRQAGSTPDPGSDRGSDRGPDQGPD